MTEFFLIAKISALDGKNGFLKIEPFSDFSDRFSKLGKIYVDFFGDKKELFVEEVRKKKSSWSIRIKNFFSEEECSLLLGKDIFVDSENVFPLPENTFFIHDLMGSKVFRNNELVGKIVDVLRTAANDVYVLNDEKGNEILIPALISLIESFDPITKIMVLTPGDELYYDED
ncbi:MAG: ribosome maturation factor RimM [Ignavibacteria bacterium]|nr:ribosome maturation factor RimM [Ignavibacteria bacterium]